MFLIRQKTIWAEKNEEITYKIIKHDFRNESPFSGGIHYRSRDSRMAGEDGDYVEKDQAIAEVDSDKATLELPAEESGIITLKAEVGDAVAVGAVVCLIDTSAAKPSGGSAERRSLQKGGGRS